MADAGVGEAAVAEGAKGAAEAGAAEAAAGTVAAEAGGAAAGAGLSSAELGSLYGAAGYGEAATAAELAGGTAAAAGAGDAVAGGTNLFAGDTAGGTASNVGGGAFSSSATAGAPASGGTNLFASDIPGGAASNVGGGASAADPSLWSSTIKPGLQYANAANSGVNFAKDPNLQTGLSLAGSAYGLGDAAPAAGATSSGFDTPTGAPVGGSDLGAPEIGPESAGSLPTGAGPTAGGLTGNASIDAALSALGAGGKAVGQGLKEYGPAINAGLAGTSMVMQAHNAGGAQKQLQDIAGPAQQTSNQLLQQFQSGQITGADAYNISTFASQQKAQIDQYYAKAGLSNSSMHTQALQQVDQQAEAMRQQAVQNLLTGGLKAAGVSNPTLVAGVNAGVKQDELASNSMQNFINTLAKMNTPQASAPPAQTGMGS